MIARFAVAVSLTVAVAAAVAFGCVAAPAAAQEPLSLLSNDHAAAEEFERIVDAARRDSLPVAPIFAKAQYGALVAHAPPLRIVASAKAVAERLAVARAALAPGATAADIAAGADALGCGATRDALRAIRAAGSGRSLAAPLGVLAQLVTSGVPSRRAAEIVSDLMRRGASAEQLVSLGNDVDGDVARGAAAVNALDTRLRGLTAVLAPGGAGGNGVTAPTVTSGGTPKKP